MLVKQIRRLIVLALLLTPSALSAAIVANFDGGNGTASSDQFAGIAGNGWASAWGSAGTSATNVTTTSPLSGGGNYLAVTDDATSTATFIRRQYQSFGDVNITTQPYRISFSYRFDGSLAQFTDFNDRLAIFGDSTAQGATGASNSWIIGVGGGNNGATGGNSVYPGEWYFFDNNGSNGFNTGNMFDTNLALVSGRVYNITVDVDPVTGSYGASINDGVNPVVSATNLTFRNGTTTTSTFFHVGMASTAGADSSAFSIDNISIAAIPEPAGITVILGACLAAGLMAGKRLRKKFSSG